MVQEQIADSWIALEQFRLLVLQTAWRIDKYKDYRKVRKDIAAVKVAMPKVYHDIASAAMHLHGALGVSNEMPFTQMLLGSMVMGIADGPTEVHKVTVAKQVLRDYRPDNDLFPSYHLPKLREAAEDRYPDIAAELKAQWETRCRGSAAREGPWPVFCMSCGAATFCVRLRSMRPVCGPWRKASHRLGQAWARRTG